MNKLITKIPEKKINGTLFLLPHLGLGDQLINQGLVNIFLEKFNYPTSLKASKMSCALHALR